MFNPLFTGPTLTDFPWDRGIVEEAQRSIDTVSNKADIETSSFSSILYLYILVSTYVYRVNV